MEGGRKEFVKNRTVVICSKKGGNKMVRKQLFIGFVGLFICGFIFMGSVTRAAAQNTLKIGVIWGLSGPGSQMQAIMRDSAVLAAEWINSKGGITVGGQKYKIELLVEDNKNTAEGSTSAATKLVHRDKVKFITGMVVPFQFEAVQAVSEPNQVILNTSRCGYLNPKNRYTFSAVQSFVAPYPGLYDFLLKMYSSVKTVGFSAHDEPGALATLKVAQEVAKGHGLKLLDSVSTQFGTKEYYPAWTKLLKDKPDVVDIGISFPDSLAANVRQGREIGFKGPILSPGTGDSTMFLNLIGKDMATDFLFAGFDMFAPDNPAMVKQIMKLWEDKYKKPFNLDALDAWSTVWALTQAIEKAQSLDPTQVVKTWENMKSIETPWGAGTMGGAKTYGINHMVLAPAPISRLQNGKVDSTHWYKPDVP
jgi:branched-chain amino acid transport system substrate-binding protein